VSDRDKDIEILALRPREQAGRYLAFLSSLGYPLSGIEQAVPDGTTWTGDKASLSHPPGRLLERWPGREAIWTSAIIAARFALIRSSRLCPV
jgi:hypothetical protein